MDQLIDRFVALFAGLSRGFGTYVVDDAEVAAGTKRTGRALTHKQTLTRQHYIDHLNKTDGIGLGVVPINEDSKCVFAALDIDKYDVEFSDVLARINKLNLPLVPCTTKSGGLHLYLFFAEPVACVTVRAKLKQMSEALGFSGVEIFPKQEQLGSDEDIGNWINLPYYGGLLKQTEVERIAHNLDTPTYEKISNFEAFLTYAEGRRITREQLEKMQLLADVVKMPFIDGPPCLQRLAALKVGMGGRNIALYQFAVYAKMRYPDTWRTVLYEYNGKYFDPPLADSEVTTTIKSIDRKAYFYKCKEEPMAAVCNRDTCLKRKFGIGAGHADGITLEYGPLQKMVIQDSEGRMTDDDPLYFWTINGKMIRLTAAELLQPKAFQKAVMERLDVIPSTMKMDAWLNFINELLPKVDILIAPFESGGAGQFIAAVQDFVAENSRADSIADIEFGSVFVDQSPDGTIRAYFQWKHLSQFLTAGRVVMLSQKDHWLTLRKYMDAVTEQRSIGGKPLRIWSVKLPSDFKLERDAPDPKEPRGAF